MLSPKFVKPKRFRKERRWCNNIKDEGRGGFRIWEGQIEEKKNWGAKTKKIRKFRGKKLIYIYIYIYYFREGKPHALGGQAPPRLEVAPPLDEGIVIRTDGKEMANEKRRKNMNPLRGGNAST
jgi:hypothetical protein